MLERRRNRKEAALYAGKFVAKIFLFMMALIIPLSLYLHHKVATEAPEALEALSTTGQLTFFGLLPFMMLIFFVSEYANARQEKTRAEKEGERRCRELAIEDQERAEARRLLEKYPDLLEGNGDQNVR